MFRVSNRFLKPAAFAAVFFLIGQPVFSGESAAKMYQDGMQALSRGDRENARYFFRRALEINPGYREAALADGDLNFQMGDLNRARESYERVLSIEPEQTRALIGLARVRTAGGQFGEAEKLLAAAEKVDPSNEGAFHARGELNWKLGRRDIAAGYFERALRKNPSHLATLLSLSVLETERGRTERASALIARARRMDPENPEVYLAEGDIAFRRLLSEKDPVERKALVSLARRSYRAALDIAPQSVPVQSNLVVLDLYSGPTKETASRVRSLMDQEPSNPRWYYLHALLGQGKIQDTLYASTRAMTLAPQDSFIRYRHEALLIANPDVAGLETRRNAAKFHSRLMAGAQSAGRTDLRDFHASAALRLYPDQRDALNLLLDQARRNGDYEGYLDYLLRIRQVDASPSIQFQIDEALRQKNKDMAMRDGLYSRSAGSFRQNYERSPRRILVFDFRSETPFPRIPDAGEILASALREHLTVRTAPLSELKRRKIFESIRQAEGRSGPVFFTPAAVRSIPENSVSAIVAGSFVLRDNGVLVRYEVYDERGARILDRFETIEEGEDALHRASVRAATRIAGLFLPAGQVIRIGESVYINVGRADGIKKGDVLAIKRGGSKIGELKIEETSYLVSRGLPSVALTSIFAGDRVEKEPPRN